MADNNNEINLKLSVSNIPQSDINKVAGTVDSMVNNLNDKLVVKVNFGSINKNIREVAKGFKEFSNTIKELNSYFSDVSKMTSRAYDTTKKVMNDLGAVNKSVTTDIKNHSMSELQDLSKYSLKLLKQAEATAKKRVSLITAKGEDPSKALDNLYAKSQAVAIKEYQSARDYSDAAHSELFTKLALLKDQHEQRILDIDSKYRKHGLGAYAQTEEQKTNTLLAENKKRQEANSKIADKELESSRKAAINKARDITKDKHDAWLYDPKNAEKKNDYISSAKELSHLRINPSTSEDFEDLKRKEQNIDDYVKKREAGNLKSVSSMNAKKESLMADHYKRLAMLSDKHDEDYLKALNKASYQKLESKGIDPYSINKINGNTKTAIDIEREKNQHKLDEVIKARQKTSVDILKNEEKVLREEITIYKQIAKTNGDHDDVLLSKMNQADKLKTDRLGNPEMLAAKEEANKAEMISIENSRREKSVVLLKEELAVIKEQIKLTKKNSLDNSASGNEYDPTYHKMLLKEKTDLEHRIADGLGKPLDDNTSIDKRAANHYEVESYTKKNKQAYLKYYKEQNQARFEELKEKKKYAEKLANIDYAGLEAYRKTSEELAIETAKRKGFTNFKEDGNGTDFVSKQMANVQLGINNKKAKLDQKFQEAGRAALIKNYADNIRIHNDANRDEVQSYEKKYRDLRLIQMKIDDIRNNETMSPEDKKITEASYNRKISTEIEKIRAKNAKSDAASNKAELLNENNSATQQLEQKKAYWEKVGFHDRNYRKMRIAAAREEADQMAKTMGLGQRETLKLQKQFVSDVEKEYQSAMGHGSSYAQSIMAKIRGLLVFTGFGFVVKQALVAISKAGIEFNDTMAGVRAVTNASNAEFEKLITSARTLAIETRYTANEVAQLQDIYAKLGLSVSSILEASKPTLDLATATGENLAETAESVAVTLNGFQLSADQTTRVVDVMAKSFVESALDLERYREGMKLAAPVANALNMSVEQTTSLFAMLSNIGISGSMAGTGIRNVLSQASSSSSKLSKVLGGTASTWEEFIELLRTANRRGEEFKRTALSDLDLRIKGVVVALAENVEKLDDVAIGYENASDSAKKMADIKLDTAAGDLDVWANVFNEEKIQMFGSAEKNLRGLIKTATELTKGLAELVIVAKNLGEGFLWTAGVIGTVKGFNAAISAHKFLVAAIKDASAAQYAMQIVNGQNTLVMTQAATATTLLGKSAAVAGGALKSLWLTMLANPIIAGTLVIGGLITAINYMNEAEERAIKRNREYNDSLTKLLQDSKDRTEKNIDLMKRYIELRDMPKSQKEDGSINKEREATLLKILIDRYPELAKEVKKVDSIYATLNATLKEYNKQLDQAKMMKIDIDIREAKLAIKDLKNSWGDYVAWFAQKNIWWVKIFADKEDVDFKREKAFRDDSETAKLGSEIYNKGANADPKDIDRFNQLVEIQKDLALKRKLNISLTQEEQADAEEDYNRLVGYQSSMKKISEHISFIKTQTSKKDAVESSKAFGGSDEVDTAIKGAIEFYKQAEKRIVQYQGETEEIKKIMSEMDEMKKKMFNQNKDGHSYMTLGIALEWINPEELKTIEKSIDTAYKNAEYAKTKHFVTGSDELLLTKGMGSENYSAAVKAQMRNLWISESQYNALGIKDKEKHDKLALDIMYKRRKVEDEIVKSGEKDKAKIEKMRTDLFTKELNDRLKEFKAFYKNIEDIAAAGNAMLKLPVMSDSDEWNAFEQQQQEANESREDAHLAYLNKMKLSKTEDGRYTPEARKLRFEQLLREYTKTESLKDLGKTDSINGKTVDVPLILQKDTHDRKMRKMAEAEILAEEGGGSKKKREDKSEQLRPDLISIRKKINEFNQKEQAKEIAELENFYSEKIALVSYGEKAAYAKRTELDKKTAADVARSIDETNSLEALKATAFKSLADKSVSIDGELRQNLIDQSKAGGDKGELARLRLEYKNIESEQKSHNKKIIDLKKQLNGENGAEAQRFAKVAIKMIADEEMQKQQVIKKYADIRAKEIRDMQNSIDQNEYRKQLYSIENERTDGLKKYQQNESDSSSVSSDKLTQRMLVEEKYALAKRDLQKKATKELMSANDDVLNAALDGYEEERKKFKDMYDQKLITATQFSYSMRTIDIKEKSSRSEADGNKSDIEVYARLKKIRAMGDKARAEEAKERAKQILDEYELEKSVLSEKIQGIKDYYAADTMLAAESINAISKLKRDGLMTRRSELEENFRNVNSNENSTPEEKLKASTELNDFNFQSKEQEISLLSKEEEVRTKLRDLMADTSLEDIAFQTKLLKLKKELELTEEQYKALLKLRNLQSKEISNANDIKVEGTIGSLIDSYGKAAAAFQKYADTRTAGNPQQSEEMEASHNALIAYGKAAGDTIDVVAGMYSSIRTLGEADTQNQIDKVNRDKEANIAALDDQHEKGMWSKTQYENKKKAINEKALEEERKIKKKQKVWTEIQIIIDTAAGIAKAFAQGGILGFITGGLIAAAGAAQLKAVQQQKFAKGGFTGPGTVRDETGKRVAGVVHQNEVVFEEAITMPNLGGLMEIRRLLQSGVKLRDIVNPKININKVPRLPNLPQHVYATGGFTGNNSALVNASLSSNISAQLLDVVNSIEVLNKNLIEKVMTVNVEAKTIDPIKVHDLSEEGKKSKGYLYDK